MFVPRPCALRWLHCCDPAASCRCVVMVKPSSQLVYLISNWLVVWVLDVFLNIFHETANILSVGELSMELSTGWW